MLSGAGSTFGASPRRRRRSDYVLLYSHGNAEDLGLNKELMEWMSDNMDISVLAYDYTGVCPLRVITTAAPHAAAFGRPRRLPVALILLA